MIPDRAARPLLGDFVGHAPWRLAGAVGLVFAGALLEGAGILLLVPLLDLALGPEGGLTGRAAAWSGEFFETLGLATPGARLAALLGLFSLAVGLRAVIHLKRDLALFALTETFIAELRARAFRALAARSWRALAGIERGAVGHALGRDVDRVESGASAILNGLTAALIIVVQLAIAASLAPMLTGLAILAGTAGLAGLHRLRARAVERGERYGAEDLGMYTTATAFLAGLKPAKAHGLERDYVAAFERALGRRLGVMRGWLIDQAVARLLVQSGAAFAAVGAIVIGVYWLATPPATLIVLVAILARIYGPVQTLQMSVQLLNYAAAGYRVTRALAGEAVPSPEGVPEPLAAPVVAGLERAPRIDFEDVTLCSDEAGARPILERIDASLPAGILSVLCGPSGAGKSSFADLAVGLGQPDGGRVTLDGQLLEGAVAARLRASIAWVGQEPFMPAVTLRDTLTWGAGRASDREIMEALDLVGGAALAETREGGLDGRIGADGRRFSGGERQRIGLARAWLRRPRLLVLDEATNALDPESEARVLDRLLGRTDATVLMISHRPGAERRADNLIRLEAGRVVGSPPRPVPAKHQAHPSAAG